MLLERPYYLCLTLPGNQMLGLERWRFSLAQQFGIPDIDAMAVHIPLAWLSKPCHRHTLLEAKKIPWNKQRSTELYLSSNYLGQQILALGISDLFNNQALGSMGSLLLAQECARDNDIVLEKDSALYLSNPFRSFPQLDFSQINPINKMIISAPLLSQYQFIINETSIEWYLLDEMRVIKQV